MQSTQLTFQPSSQIRTFCMLFIYAILCVFFSFRESTNDDREFRIMWLFCTTPTGHVTGACALSTLAFNTERSTISVAIELFTARCYAFIRQHVPVCPSVWPTREFCRNSYPYRYHQTLFLGLITPSFRFFARILRYNIPRNPSAWAFNTPDRTIGNYCRPRPYISLDLGNGTRQGQSYCG